MNSIYDFKAKTIDGRIDNLSNYKGKVLLIVNTATGCGFTPQYKQLEEIYKKYHQNGFEILDFPCNQFANQAPQSNSEIHSFCTLNFGVSFQQFEKIDVNGPKADPIFVYLKEKKRGLFGKRIKWNFTKFLVGRNGDVIKRFSPATNPLKIEKYIRKELSI